ATALSNLQLAYNPRSGTLDTRDNNNNQQNQNTLLCSVFTAIGQPCSAIPAGASLRQTQAAPGDDRTLGGILEAGR
ncbi:MAG: hypothetical protein ABR614_02190, partial [Mycobacteriales bacterium]